MTNAAMVQESLSFVLHNFPLLDLSIDHFLLLSHHTEGRRLKHILVIKHIKYHHLIAFTTTPFRVMAQEMLSFTLKKFSPCYAKSRFLSWGSGIVSTIATPKSSTISSDMVVVRPPRLMLNRRWIILFDRRVMI